MAQIRKRKTFPLRLTKYELLHLRDLFSVVLATETQQTVSQGLAAAEDRSLIESRLWLRVARACSEADIPLDDDAPDFVCAASSAPSVGVFRIAHEPNERVVAEDKRKNPFGDGDDSEADEESE